MPLPAFARGGQTTSWRGASRPGSVVRVLHGLRHAARRRVAQVRAQRPRVEYAVELGVVEARLAQLAELLRPVLADVPRIAGALGARRRECEDVRSGDVGHAARREERAEVLQRPARILEVLDRL